MITKTYLTSSELLARAEQIARHVEPTGTLRIYGVPRGGIPAAYLLSKCIPDSWVTNNPEDADIIIDDIIDSGATALRHAMYKAPFFGLIDKQNADADIGWVVLPWEVTDKDTDEHDHAARLIQHKGGKAAPALVERILKIVQEEIKNAPRE